MMHYLTLYGHIGHNALFDTIWSYLSQCTV